MKFVDLDQKILSCFSEATERNIDEYSNLKYPSKLPLLRMYVKSYELPGFGYLMCMNTSMMNIMKLSTFSLIPSSGISVPYLLIDTMSMGKKRLAYVEFYDCRKEKTKIMELENLEQKYQFLKNYQENPSWYVKERMTGSLIKCAVKDQEEVLCDMIADALQEYSLKAKQANHDLENRKGLEAFSERMIYEGNPSSKILNKILGKEKAEEFFRKVVMPIVPDAIN